MDLKLMEYVTRHILPNIMNAITVMEHNLKYIMKKAVIPQI